MTPNFSSTPEDIRNIWSRALLQEMYPRPSPEDPRNACTNAAAKHLGAKYLEYLEEQLGPPPIKSETSPGCTLSVGTAPEEKVFACVVSPSAFEILKNVGVIPMSESEDCQAEEVEEELGKLIYNDMPIEHFQAIRKMVPPVKVRDIHLCTAGKISEDSRLDKYTTTAPSVSYDNEVLRFQAMGMPPAGGEGRDGWREVYDIIYPITGLFQHDNDYKLECIAQSGGDAWRLLDDKGTIIDARYNMAPYDTLKAKAWASKIIAGLKRTAANTVIYDDVLVVDQTLDRSQRMSKKFITTQMAKLGKSMFGGLIDSETVKTISEMAQADGEYIPVTSADTSIIDDIIDGVADDLANKHKAWNALYYQEPKPIGTVTAAVRDEYGAAAVLDIKSDEPAPLQALTTREFKPGKTYVQIHASARARAFQIDHTFPEEYLDDLEKLQGKFYEVKGFYPTRREYSLMNDLIIDAECTQMVYRVPH